MIEVNKSCFGYTNEPFVKDVSFRVGRGEIFGFLGSSGAGKSTTQEVLTDLNARYKGSVKVTGTEIRERTNRLYGRIGVNFGSSTCYEEFTARENLKYFGLLYDRPLRSTEELLKTMGLENDDDKRASDFSKGTRPRLNFIKVLVYSPDILFLDEPTSGFNSTNSRLMRDIILAEKKRGKTIVITTHDMPDATELYDQVTFIVSGKVSALDTPHNLIMSRGAARIRYAYFEDEEKTDECTLVQTPDDKQLNELIRSSSFHSVHSSEPTLNNIFVDITGRTLQ